MKKINYFLLLIAMLSSFSLQARKIVVNTAATLQTAFNGALDFDTIVLKPGIYDTTNKLIFPKTGLVVVESFYNTPVDSIATIRTAMQSVTVEDGAYAKRPSLIFNNLKLTGRYNDFISSTYMIDFNGKFISVDTLAFRNCEISNCARSMIRGGLLAGKTSCGDMEWFEMTNCKVHDFNGMDTHSWPIVYLAHIPMYVSFKNNSFYDIPYNKSIYQLTKMTVVAARAAEITFENNLVATTFARADGIIATGAFLSEEAKYFINNNMFIIPKYADAQNLTKDSLKYYSIPPILKCKFGIITANNNIVDSMRPWIAGQSLDLEGQGGFLVIDTLNTYKMRDLNFAWEDFANAQGNDFTYFSSKQPATAGIGGKPIGDPRWVKSLLNPKTLTANANIAGAVVTPQKGFYENGSAVTVKASAVDGYTFKGWYMVSDNSLISTANPYTFNISADMDISAKYEALQAKNITVTISGSKSASYTITPKKTIYYEGDVVTVAVNTHYLNDFLGWNDGNMDMSRTITLAGSDVALTANFTEQPYLLAWDFHQLTANNQTFTNLAANHAANVANPGVMNAVSLDTIRTVSTRNNKFTTVGLVQNNCVARRTIIANFGNPDYLFIKFSSKGLTNLAVKSEIATDNSMFKVQKLQYALDGKNYVDFKADTITGNIDMIWRKLEGSLPVAAENQDSIFVRWIADSSSERLFVTGVTASDYDYAYISKIIVTASGISGVNNMNVDNNFKIYANADKLIVRANKSGKAEVYSLMGQKIKELNIIEGMNEFAGIQSGIYLVRVGSEVQKVLIK